MRGQQQIYDYLAELGIVFDYYEHPAVHTIEESSHYYRGEGTTMCKNLFFRNHKGNKHYLVVMEAQHSMNIRDIELRLHQGKLSFASPERMMKYLGVTPGSVSLFNLVNDVNHEVILFVDSQLKKAKRVSFHPNDNTASLVISEDDMEKFIESIGNEYKFLDLYEENVENVKRVGERPVENVENIVNN